jgi:hypothetical protein
LHLIVGVAPCVRWRAVPEADDRMVTSGWDGSADIRIPGLRLCQEFRSARRLPGAPGEKRTMFDGRQARVSGVRIIDGELVAKPPGTQPMLDRSPAGSRGTARDGLEGTADGQTEEYGQSPSDGRDHDVSGPGSLVEGLTMGWAVMPRSRIWPQASSIR